MSTLTTAPNARHGFRNETQASHSTSRDLNGIRRTVSFSENLSKPRAMDAESSADEHTAILRRQKDRKRNYDAAQASSQNAQGPSPTPSSTRRIPLASPSQYDGSSEQADDRPPRLNWWKRLLDKYGTVELQNKGSVARDHLALERTFLAWLRTSLSFASIGVAVTQLFRLDQGQMNNSANHIQVQKLRHTGRPLGATFLGVGILVLLIGFHRYFEGQHYVIKGKFPASRASVALVAFCSGGLVIGSLAVVATMAPVFDT